MENMKMKGGNSIAYMEKNMMIWVVIGVMLLATLFLTYKASSSTGTVSTDKLDTTGWTANEVMNYEMHGTIPARLQGKVAASQSSGSGMVGGC